MRILTLIVFCLIFIVPGCNHQSAHKTEERSYQRIISFAPSITETLFALSLGDRVVGVTDFCNFPPKVKTLSKVGGFTNPNYEAILRLKPDLILLLKEHTSLFKFLEKNNIDYVCIDNQNVSSILSSFGAIGKKCGRIKQADSLVQQITKEMLPETLSGLWPKALLCVDRESRGNGKITHIYCAGKKSFYNDLLYAASIQNVLEDSTIIYPELSTEGIIRLQPDIIIDFTMSSNAVSEQKTKSDWACLPMIPAVKNNRVFCISNDYATVPGPRILEIVRDFKKINLQYRGIN